MRAIAFGLSLSVFCIGVSSTLGYAIGLTRLYNWDNGTGMSLAASIAFLCSGIALCILSSRSHSKSCLFPEQPSR